MALAAIGYWGGVITGSHDPDAFTAAGIANSIVNAGAFSVAAWVMVLVRVVGLVEDRPVSMRAVLIAFGFGLLYAIPAEPVTALALAVLGGGLLWRQEATRRGRQAGLLLLLLGVALASRLLSPIHNMVRVWMAGRWRGCRNSPGTKSR